MQLARTVECATSRTLSTVNPVEISDPYGQTNPTRGKQMTNIEKPFPNPALSSPDDEIDLWQLMVTLWEGKYWIIGITFLCCVAGLGYVKLSEERWNSTAKVIKPDYSRYQEVLAYTRRLEPAFGNQFNDRIKDLGFGNSEEVFKRFITLFNSADNKREFLKEHPLFLQQLGDSQDETKLMNSWINNIAASSNKNAPDEYELSFMGRTARDSQSLLMDYIRFSNNKMAHDFQDNLGSMVAQRIEELKRTLKTLEINTQSQIYREIERLTHSLAIAKAANINTPIVDPGTKDEFDINLGTRAIEAKIAELKSLKNLAVIEPAMLNVRNQLTVAESIDLSTSPSFESYKFIQTPEEPLSRAHPKTLLILLASLVIGGAMGVVIVVIKNTIRVHTQSTEP